METPESLRLKLFITLAIALVPVIWAGCSVAEHRETLSFWFDGVPTEEQELAAIEAKLLKEAREAQGPLTSAQRAAMLRVRVKKVEHSTHKPVDEERCTECHIMTAADTETASGWVSDLPELLAPMSELCLRCHEVPEGTFKHGPAASGNCALCHQSHTSLYPHLLRRSPMKELCLACHDPVDLIDPEGHTEYEDFDCVDCHNPHASEQEYLLHLDYPRVPELAEQQDEG